MQPLASGTIIKMWQRRLIRWLIVCYMVNQALEGWPRPWILGSRVTHSNPQEDHAPFKVYQDT